MEVGDEALDQTIVSSSRRDRDLGVRDDLPGPDDVGVRDLGVWPDLRRPARRDERRPRGRALRRCAQLRYLPRRRYPDLYFQLLAIWLREPPEGWWGRDHYLRP